MPFIPDFEDPRYLHEVGWFPYYPKNNYHSSVETFADS